MIIIFYLYHFSQSYSTSKTFVCEIQVSILIEYIVHVKHDAVKFKRKH